MKLLFQIVEHLIDSKLRRDCTYAVMQKFLILSLVLIVFNNILELFGFSNFQVLFHSVSSLCLVLIYFTDIYFVEPILIQFKLLIFSLNPDEECCSCL